MQKRVGLCAKFLFMFWCPKVFFYIRRLCSWHVKRSRRATWRRNRHVSSPRATRISYFLFVSPNLRWGYPRQPGAGRSDGEKGKERARCDRRRTCAPIRLVSGNEARENKRRKSATALQPRSDKNPYVVPGIGQSAGVKPRMKSVQNFILFF